MVSACKLSLKCKGCGLEDHNTLICKQSSDSKKKPDPKKKKGKETSSNKTETEIEEPPAADDPPTTEDETSSNFTDLRCYEATAIEVFLLSRSNRSSAFTQMGVGSVQNGRTKS